jgi:hypothetical protein
MAIYYAAVEGDPLDSGKGGYVYGTKKTVGTIVDNAGKRRNMVFVGDAGYCARCNNTGVISFGAGVSKRKRMVDFLNGGRLQAVGGDVLLCKCAKPPRIVATYGLKFKINDVGSSISAGIARNAPDPTTSAQRKPESLRHVRWFFLWDAATGQPLRNRSYVADIGDTRRFGKTDNDGYVKIETDATQPVDIHAIFSSPKKTLTPDQGA